MPSKNEITTLNTVCELKISHADIINMMNDTDVQLCGGDIDPSQIMDVLVVRENGSEVSIERFEKTDTVVFRFKTKTVTGGETDFNDVDIS